MHVHIHVCIYVLVQLQFQLFSPTFILYFRSQDNICTHKSGYGRKEWNEATAGDCTYYVYTLYMYTCFMIMWHVPIVGMSLFCDCLDNAVLKNCMDFFSYIYIHMKLFYIYMYMYTYNVHVHVQADAVYPGWAAISYEGSWLLCCGHGKRWILLLLISFTVLSVIWSCTHIYHVQAQVQIL